MNYSVKTTSNTSDFVLLTTNYTFNHSDQPEKTKQKSNSIRLPSQIGTNSYKRSLRRSFSHAKLLAFFNPDLTQFITLTYKNNEQNIDKVYQDIKNLIKQQTKLNIQQQHIQNQQKIQKQEITINKKLNCAPPSLKNKTTNELQNDLSTYPHRQALTKSSIIAVDQVVKSKTIIKPKYIYVLELQKRGAIHVHMLCNEFFDTKRIRGHLNVSMWVKHGFSEVLTINDFDKDFKTYLYLFKYMNKAQRIGKSFIHVSKTFDKIQTLDYADYINRLNEDNILFEEDFTFKLKQQSCTINKKYYRE